MGICIKKHAIPPGDPNPTNKNSVMVVTWLMSFVNIEVLPHMNNDIGSLCLYTH